MYHMSPLDWLTLMTYFTMIMLMFNTLNYFNLQFKITKNKMKSYISKLNWKW
uniref:ATP synthase F0 subunit 8 n=1 Tax=Eucnemidae sp. 4 ACP-2013 TaxID=1434503 RepID=A0A3G4RYD2_9COLE|nr:ATP synthase F0 subunit 8 [Eucnemidae sp. 4 ACP-2013]